MRRASWRPISCGWKNRSARWRSSASCWTPAWPSTSSNFAIAPIRSSGRWNSPPPAWRGWQPPGSMCSWTAARLRQHWSGWPRLIAAGADVLQLRDKGLDDRRLVERARLLREADRRDGDAVDRQRPARRGPPGPRRRRPPRPRGPLGQGRPVDRRARGPGRRFDAFASSRPGRRSSTGPTTSASGRRFPPARSSSRSFPASPSCGRWPPKFACRPLPSAASRPATWPRSWPPASAASPSAGPSPPPPIRPPWREKCRRG